MNFSNNAIHICHMTSVHPALDFRIFYKEAKTLVEDGYDVTLIAQHNKNEIVEGIKIVSLSKPKNRFFRIFITNRKLFYLALKQKVSVYHFHDPELLSWAIKLKKKTNAKIIYDVHEDISRQILSKYWLPKIIRRPISFLFNYFEKLVSQKFNYIIAATPDIKKNFKKHKVIDIKNYPVINHISRTNRWNFVKNEYTLIYIGGLEKVRGIKEIIQSLKFMNPKYNIKLKLAGEFSEENFKKEVQKLEEWKKVQYLGRIPHKEVFKHLAKGDIGLVCLYPLRRFLTALPVKMFEYMVTGLPVIASNFPFWREIIEKNNCGICVNPLSPKEIAKAVEYLIENHNEAKKMGENGREAVLEKYNWENESKKLLKIYKELLQ